MKRVTVTMLCLVLLLTACQKTELTASREASTRLTRTKTAPIAETNADDSAGTQGLTITGWEQGETRLRAANGNDVRYHIVRGFPQMTQEFLADGVVLVFAKGYNLAGSDIQMPALAVPFCFYQPSGETTVPVFFEYAKRPGAIDVNLKMQPESAAMLDAGRGNIEFRYFLLSRQELAKQGLTPEKAHNLGYRQLVARYGLQP